VTRIALGVQDFIRLDVSIPLFSTGTALLVPWPDEESRLLAPVHPFQPTVISIFNFYFNTWNYHLVSSCFNYVLFYITILYLL